MSDAPAPAEDPIIPSVRYVLALFGSALQTVKFPDVDGDALGLQALQVEEHAATVKQLEEALHEARKRLEESQETLLQKAWRAVAYARVYADGDPQLSARLEAITFPVRTKSARSAPSTTTAEQPKKRGRPRSVAPDASLFTVPQAVDAAVDVDVDADAHLDVDDAQAA